MENKIEINGETVQMPEGYELVTDPTLPKMADWLALSSSNNWYNPKGYGEPQVEDVVYIRPIIRTLEDLERNEYVQVNGGKIQEGDYFVTSTKHTVKANASIGTKIDCLTYRHKSKLTQTEPKKESEANELTKQFELGFNEAFEVISSKIYIKLHKLQREYFEEGKDTSELYGKIQLLYELLKELKDGCFFQPTLKLFPFRQSIDCIGCIDENSEDYQKFLCELVNEAKSEKGGKIFKSVKELKDENSKD